MTVGIRTEALRKVFTSPPPVGGGRSSGGRSRKAKSAYEVVALDDLTLEVRAGEIFGLLGPNGAGKSTTVGVLTTRVKPELKRSIPGGFLVQLHFDKVPEALIARLQRLPGVTEARARPDSQLDLYADRGGSLIPAIVSAATVCGATIRDVHISEPSLENLFLHHTGRSLRE